NRGTRTQKTVVPVPETRRCLYRKKRRKSANSRRDGAWENCPGNSLVTTSPGKKTGNNPLPGIVEVELGKGVKGYAFHRGQGSNPSRNKTLFDYQRHNNNQLRHPRQLG